MNLGQRQVGMLKVHFFRIPSMSEFVHDDFDDLDIRVINPSDALIVKLYMSGRGATSFYLLFLLILNQDGRSGIQLWNREVAFFEQRDVFFHPPFCPDTDNPLLNCPLR
ncbi:MAG: hypothetical protein OJF51_004805 [Nitrospira sp.]|nr:MAG: hypothetical protein OJF51_004805 [Nitrospira sp.]